MLCPLAFSREKVTYYRKEGGTNPTTKVTLSGGRPTSTTTNMHINDLSDVILANIARYLAAPSAAMFSIAVTQDGASSN